MNGDTILKLKNFCKDSLTLMGADVSENSDGVLSVNIPSSAIDLFEGRSSIRLAFKAEQVDEGIELVVPESYVLTRLLESMQQRGELASAALEPLYQASPASGIKLANASERYMSSDSSYRDLLFANFRVTLVSDENQDKLFSVIIDILTGEPSLVDPKYILESLKAAAPNDKITPGSNPEKAFASAKKAVQSFSQEWAASEQQKIDIRFKSEVSRLDAYYKEMKSDVGTQSADTRKIQILRNKTIEACEKTNLLYDTAKEFIETTNNEDELTKALDLKLDELKKIKGKYSWSFSNNYNAIADIEAQMSVAKKSAAIAQRLLRSNKPDNKLIDLEQKRQKALIATQKQAEIKESTQFDPEHLQSLQNQDEQLDSEKAQRIAELQDKFQLKVVTVPVSLSLIRLPYIQYNYDAVAGSISIPFASYHDLITGKIQSPKCQSCSGEIISGYACSCGHLTCESCHKSCLACGKDMCSKCLSGACQICGEHCVIIAGSPVKLAASLHAKAIPESVKTAAR